MSNEIEVKKNSGRKKDKIRNLYVVNDKKLCCNVENCTKQFSLFSSIPVLRDHITKYHKSYVCIHEQKENLTPSLIGDNMEENIIRTLSIAFAKNSLPHNLIENKYFKSLLELLKPDIKITKKRLKETILSESENINRNLLDRLIVSNTPITVAIDGWSNIRSNKVTNILIISSGVPYFYASIENINNRNTIEYLLPTIEQHLKHLMELGLNIIAITTDNENLMKNMRIQLNKSYPVLIIVPCTAHIIQLCLKTILNIDEVQIIINETYDIFKKFKSNKNYKRQLIDLQKNDNIDNPMKIIYPTEVRWSTLIIAIERLLLLKKYINHVIKIRKSYWIDLNSLYIFVERFKQMTNYAQKDTASLYSVWNNFNDIKSFYTSDKIPKKFIGISEKTVNVIQTKWESHINSELIEASRLFNLENNFKFSEKTIKFIIEWSTLYIVTYNISNIKNENNIKRIIQMQLNEFIGRQNEFSLVNGRDKELADTYKSQSKTYNVRVLWAEYLTSHYELAKSAIAILSICPSESSVERSFSIQSNVHSIERNGLGNDIINAEMIIKMNYS